MRVLLIGSGGREHALVRGLLADPSVSALVVAPGNPGIATERSPHSGAVVEVAPLDLGSPDVAAQVARLAVEHRADLVVIGPEAPLVAGAADAVRAAGIACFGPSQAAAQLEGSKAFAKQVMADAGVPTAGYAVCSTLEHVQTALETFGSPHVVKADGLAAGKGVVVTEDLTAALAHAQACLGEPGARVVIEEYLDGPEASLFAITDGTSAVALPAAQDFKRVGTGDSGPNTGGMGAYAPLPWAPADLGEQVVEQVVHPTLARMRQLGTPYQGLLYVGLALTSRGLRVVEFNARFGDPETQVVIPLLETPLGQLLHAAATGRLADLGPLRVRQGSAVTVVLAAPGYPQQTLTGGRLTGVAQGQAEDGPVAVLHAGTGRDEQGHLVATGGRVLAVTAYASTLSQAQQQAYQRLEQIHLPGGHYRTDIAQAALDGRIGVG